MRWLLSQAVGTCTVEAVLGRGARPGLVLVGREIQGKELSITTTRGAERSRLTNDRLGQGSLKSFWKDVQDGDIGLMALTAVQVSLTASWGVKSGHRSHFGPLLRERMMKRKSIGRVSVSRATNHQAISEADCRHLRRDAAWDWLPWLESSVSYQNATTDSRDKPSVRRAMMLLGSYD